MEYFGVLSLSVLRYFVQNFGGGIDLMEYLSRVVVTLELFFAAMINQEKH